MAALLVLAACGRGGAGASGRDVDTQAMDDVSGRVTVLAAASLTDALTAIGAEFEREHPGIGVEFNFGPTPALVIQVQQGAPADVVASADEPNMKKLVVGGDVDESPRIFARNRLQIAVAPGNAARITRLADLTRPGLTVAGVAPSVPVGRYTAEAFAKAGLRPPEASREEDVKAVVTKVALGEADAGVVYLTDVKAAGGKVTGVDIAEAHNVEARYPIASLRDARNRGSARAFVDFVLSPRGQEVLARFGFLTP